MLNLSEMKMIFYQLRNASELSRLIRISANEDEQLPHFNYHFVSKQTEVDVE